MKYLKYFEINGINEYSPFRIGDYAILDPKNTPDNRSVNYDIYDDFLNRIGIITHTYEPGGNVKIYFDGTKEITTVGGYDISNLPLGQWFGGDNILYHGSLEDMKLKLCVMKYNL